VTERIEVVGPTEAKTMAGPRTLLEVRQTQDEIPGMVTRVWLDEHWNRVLMETEAMGFRAERTTAASARQEVEPSQDLALSSFVKVDFPVEDPWKLDRVVYRLEIPGGFEDVALEDARQRVLKREGDTVLLEVRGLDAPEGWKRSSGEWPDPSLLKSSAYLELDSPEVRKALRQALGTGSEGKSGDMATAKRLARWVWNAVDETALDIGFATAAEVARDRKGDCTEHAVLLAALLRGAGIPSRVRAGLVLVSDGFGYHLWTQGFIGGRWVDIDATLSGEIAGAVHLGLATSDLSETSPLVSLASISRFLGNLEIEVVETGPERRR
jgi:transglutaminase-like putative cysteine protease